MKSIVFKHRRLKKFEKISPKKPKGETFEESQQEAAKEEIHLDLDAPMGQPGGEENLESIEQKEFKY